jgi:hypothetical protein
MGVTLGSPPNDVPMPNPPGPLLVDAANPGSLDGEDAHAPTTQSGAHENRCDPEAITPLDPDCPRARPLADGLSIVFDEFEATLEKRRCDEAAHEHQESQRPATAEQAAPGRAARRLWSCQDVSGVALALPAGRRLFGHEHAAALQSTGDPVDAQDRHHLFGCRVPDVTRLRKYPTWR